MQQQPSEQSTATLAFRLTLLEQELTHLRSQLALYVPQRENELQLASIRATVERIERDVGKIKEQQEAQTLQISSQRENQDKLLIRVLWGAVSAVLVILSGVLVGYLTHFFK